MECRSRCFGHGILADGGLGHVIGITVKMTRFVHVFPRALRGYSNFWVGSHFAFGATCFKVRSWKDDRHSVAYDMQPITDFNEVTMHALETIYTHLFNTKGPLPGKASVGGGAAVAQPNHVSDTTCQAVALPSPVVFFVC